jgi:hypothetical protein
VRVSRLLVAFSLSSRSNPEDELGLAERRCSLLDCDIDCAGVPHQKEVMALERPVLDRLFQNFCMLRVLLFDHAVCSEIVDRFQLIVELSEEVLHRAVLPGRDLKPLFFSVVVLGNFTEELLILEVVRKEVDPSDLKRGNCRPVHAERRHIKRLSADAKKVRFRYVRQRAVAPGGVVRPHDGRAATTPYQTRIPMNLMRQSAHPLTQFQTNQRTIKRAQYEAFEFSLTTRGVLVRNASHANPADHEYVVAIKDDLPTTCECPADEHYEGACKHRVAVAIRWPVLDAALAAQRVGQHLVNRSSDPAVRHGQTPASAD